MIRWKAISVLLLALALLLTACPDQELKERAAELKAQDAAAAQLAEDRAAGIEPDPVPEDEDPPSDDASDSGQNDPTQDEEASETPVDDEMPGCDLPSDGPHPQVVPHGVMPAVNESGNLHFNVQMCEPVDPLMPFGQFYSGFFDCPPFFGYEIHGGATLLYGDPVEANTLVDGSFWFDTGAPPPDPFPSSVPCRWASWNSQEDPVWSGGGPVIFLPPEDGNRDQLFPGSSVALP